MKKRVSSSDGEVYKGSLLPAKLLVKIDLLHGDLGAEVDGWGDRLAATHGLSRDGMEGGSVRKPWCESISRKSSDDVLELGLG